MNPRERLRARARFLADVREFFVARGFVEVDTPLLVPSPGLDVHLTAFAIEGPGPARFLSTSPEYQMKELVSDLALEEPTEPVAIFQVTRAFRRDEEGGLHAPEFAMLEWYRAPATVDQVMRDTEQLVAKACRGSVRVGGREHDARPPFARMTVLEAYERFAKVPADQTLALAQHDEDRFYRLLIEAVEPGIASLGHALFLTEYPAPQASLARKKPGDPRVSERFELYLGGVEVCNGFGELTDPVEQRVRLKTDQKVRAARGLPVYPIDERFLGALERGLPPCAGNALGLDRLLALCRGTQTIAEVMAFAPNRDLPQGGK